MEQNVLFVGIDVDDKAYHVSVFNQAENSSFEFKTGPSSDLLIRGLKRHQVDPAKAKYLAGVRRSLVAVPEKTAGARRSAPQRQSCPVSAILKPISSSATSSSRLSPTAAAVVSRC